MKFVLMMLTLSLAAFGQNMDDVEIKPEKITDSLYMLVGRGGNIGICVGEDGVFMIDDQFAPLTDKIKAAVSKINKGEVRFVINTHWHYDHTGGNENFGKAGSVIVAHENIRKRMSAGQFMADFEREVPPAPEVALPVITFTRDLTFHLNDEEIKIFHVPHAHTDGDGIVWFSKSNVVHMGDVFFSGMYPYMDVGSGGSIDGLIGAVEKVLGMCDDKTRIIPGHGPLSSKSDLQAYVEMLRSVRAGVAKHVDAGKTLEETVAAKPTAELDKKWNGFIDGDKITTFVYNSLKKR